MLPADTVQTVLVDANSSLPLLPVLESFNPAGPVTAQHLVFTIVKPMFADTTGVQNVALTNWQPGRLGGDRHGRHSLHGDRRVAGHRAHRARTRC